MSQQQLINLSLQTKQQLVSMTKQKLQKMFQDKKQTPSLIIPRNLTNFVKTQKYDRFLFNIYLYCCEFNQLMKKYTQLKQKMKTRVNEYALFLQKQKQNLTLMEKQLSYLYAGILLMNNQGSSGKDQKEQFFFQTLIYLITKVIKQQFTRQQFTLIQQQINRLFRTNRFNLIKRRHENDSLMKQFPVLKDQANRQKLTLQTIINKIPQQIIAYKKIQKLNKLNKTSAKGQSNDYSVLMGVQQIRDEQQRSPLICTWLPSRKNMLSQFSRAKYSNHLKMSQGLRQKSISCNSKPNKQRGYDKTANNQESYY